MTQRLPSTKSIEVFLRLADGATVVEIAAAMNLTPSAVSRRLQNLEAAVGVSLIDRRSNRRTLTGAGADYAEHLRPILAALRHAGEAVLPMGSKSTISILASPWFFANWVAPRLPNFLEGRPDVSVVMMTDQVGYQGSPPDITIRSGLARDARAGEAALVDFQITPFLHRKMIQQLNVQAPADLLTLPLIEHVRSKNAWQRWFAHAGVEGSHVARRISVDNSFMLSEAVLSGAGAALLPVIYASEKDRSEVSAIFPQLSIYIGTAFVSTADLCSRPEVTALREWIRSELSS
jgi:LysR family glycine cleavage system transcriptional activator